MPEEATARPGPRTRGRALTVLAVVGGVLVLLLGFTVSSSLAAAVSPNHWWIGGWGLFCSVALPALLASWIRGMRRPKKTAADEQVSRQRRRGPSTVSTIAVVNGLVLFGALLAPAVTAEQVRRHGAWWVESISSLFGAEGDNAVVRGARSSMTWLAGLLPGQPSTPEEPVAPPGGADAGPSPGGRSDGATVASRGDVGPPPPDLQPVVTAAGEVRVAYERRGAGIIVPVILHGPSSQRRVKMLFDTGATLSTIDNESLRQLGLGVSPGDPTIEVHTAAGKVRRIITVIEGVTLGAARVTGGVTVALCDPCAQGEVVGLLGLNVLRHFKVTLDDEAGQIVLQPKPSREGNLLSIRPFVDFTGATGSWKGPMLTVRATLHNRSPRALRYVKLVAELRKGGEVGRIWGEQRDVPARGQARVTLEGLSPVQAPKFQLKLEQADW